MSTIDLDESAAPVRADGRAAGSPRPVRVVAHRGAPRVRRENTLPAVAAAAAVGADAIEVDVRRTADGVAVLLHDDTLARLWGDARAVADVPWCEVARLGNGLDRIPRLDAVLDRLDGTGTVLVLDVVDPEDARVAATTVVGAAATVLVEWCGAPAAMAEVREVLPDAMVWLAWESLAAPTPTDLLVLRPSGLDLDVAFLTPATVRAAHRLGLLVSCWTVDDADLAVWAARTGADSITTDDVRLVQASLETAADGGWPALDTVPSEAEVAVRAEALVHRIANEVIAFTREHPVTAVTTKADPADLVTDVDRLVEQHVRGRVRAAFPSHGFSGEEYGDAPGDAFRWYLDPVDGTTNLANGLPWTSMSICLTRNGRPVVGAVADPWRGEVLEARHGHGARNRGRELRLRTGDASGGVTLAGNVVGTELDGHRPWSGFAAFLEALADRSCTLRVMGSGTLTLAQVAAGRGAGACVSAFDPIDHGAAVLLVHEAGGVVLDRAGPVRGFPAVGEPVLVAHPDVAEELHGIWTDALSALPAGTGTF